MDSTLVLSHQQALILCNKIKALKIKASRYDRIQYDLTKLQSTALSLQQDIQSSNISGIVLQDQYKALYYDFISLEKKYKRTLKWRKVERVMLAILALFAFSSQYVISN